MKAAVTIEFKSNSKLLYYDELTDSPNRIKSQYHDIESYKKKCVYTRCLATNPETNTKVIEYTIKSTRLLNNLTPMHLVK
jgi:hypothetical protein